MLPRPGIVLAILGIILYKKLSTGVQGKEAHYLLSVTVSECYFASISNRNGSFHKQIPAPFFYITFYSAINHYTTCSFTILNAVYKNNI